MWPHPAAHPISLLLGSTPRTKNIHWSKQPTHNYQNRSIQVSNRSIQNTHVHDIDTNTTEKQTKLSYWVILDKHVHCETNTRNHLHISIHRHRDVTTTNPHTQIHIQYKMFTLTYVTCFIRQKRLTKQTNKNTEKTLMDAVLCTQTMYTEETKMLGHNVSVFWRLEKYLSSFSR